MNHIVQIRVRFPSDVEVIMELVNISDDHEKPCFENHLIIVKPSFATRQSGGQPPDQIRKALEPPRVGRHALI